MTKVEQIQDIFNEICDEILNKMNCLNVTKFVLEEPLYYKQISNEQIFITSIEFENKHQYYDNLAFFIRLNLSNGTSMPIYELNMLDLIDLTFLINYLDNSINFKGKVQPKALHVENKDIIIADPRFVIKNNEQSFVNDIPQKTDIIENLGWDRNNLTISQILELNRTENYYLKRISELAEKKYEKTDWAKSECGTKMFKIGLENCIIKDTILENLHCTVYDSDTNDTIGEFCIESGKLGVFALDEVLKYNPDFKLNADECKATALIKNFTGDIFFIEEEYENKENTVHVIGKGNFNFITKQTGEY